MPCSGLAAVGLLYCCANEKYNHFIRGLPLPLNLSSSARTAPQDTKHISERAPASSGLLTLVLTLHEDGVVRVLDLEPFDFREEGRILRYDIASWGYK